MIFFFKVKKKKIFEKKKNCTDKKFDDFFCQKITNFMKKS